MTDIGAIAREVLEVAWSGGSQAVVDKRYSDGYTATVPLRPGPVQGKDGERGLIAERLAAFSDLRFTVHEQLVDGDRVASRWTLAGTHDGRLGPLPPSGRHGEAGGLTIHRFSDGELVEMWTMWDVFGLMKQLSPTPEPAGAAA